MCIYILKKINFNWNTGVERYKDTFMEPCTACSFVYIIYVLEAAEAGQQKKAGKAETRVLSKEAVQRRKDQEEGQQYNS